MAAMMMMAMTTVIAGHKLVRTLHLLRLSPALLIHAFLCNLKGIEVTQNAIANSSVVIEDGPIILFLTIHGSVAICLIDILKTSLHLENR